MISTIAASIHTQLFIYNCGSSIKYIRATENTPRGSGQVLPARYYLPHRTSSTVEPGVLSFFHDFFAHYSGGKELLPARARAEFDPSSASAKVTRMVKNPDQISQRNSRRNTVVVGQEFGMTRVEFGHRKRALRAKEFVSRM